MKRVLLLFAALSLACIAKTQTVEDIQVKSVDDKIIIDYKIGRSNVNQIYTVTLTCSMDGGPRFEPKSTKGDVRNNISGGKSYYTIEWDVFEDLDQVGNAEFFIKVDLVEDNTPTYIPPVSEPNREQVRESSSMNQSVNEQGRQKETFDRRFFFGYSGSTESPYGISFGGVRNWGFYVSLRMGYYRDTWESDVWLTPIGGLTKYIYSKGMYRLHAYAGLGTTYEAYEEYVYNTNYSGTAFTVDAGFISIYRMVSLAVGLEFIQDWSNNFVFGIGFVF